MVPLYYYYHYSDLKGFLLLAWLHPPTAQLAEFCWWPWCCRVREKTNVTTKCFIWFL